MQLTFLCVCRVDDTIILGALPTPSQIRKLHKEDHVNVIVNMCAEFPGYEKLYDELSIRQIRLETADFCIPSLDIIRKGLKEITDIKQNQPKKNSIYLHCKGNVQIKIC